MARTTRTIRTCIGTMTAAALGASLLAAAPARANEIPYTVSSLKFTVHTSGRGEEGPKQCVVDADLYRPRGADPAHPVPAVLTTNGFGGSKNDVGTAGTAQALARQGYAVLSYSGLGFGKSGCRISLDDPAYDGEAASQLVDFLGGKRAADDGTRAGFITRDGRHDPRVGMLGGSYGGAVQLATASVDHRIDALVPMITWNDLTYSLAPNNTDLRHGVSSGTPGAYKPQWTGGFYLLGQIQGLKELATDPDRAKAGCVNFPAELCRTKRMLDSGKFPAGETQQALKRIRDASPVSYLSRVTAPTLLIQGQQDTLFNLNEAAATYRTLRAQGTPTRMIWQQSGHSGQSEREPPLGEGGLRHSYPGQRITAWFDHYLRGDRSADRGPAFAYFRDWKAHPGGRPKDAYGTSRSFPAGDPRRLYLSGDGTLVASRKEVQRGSREYRNWRLLPSSYSENSLLAAAGVPLRTPHDAPGTHLSYTSQPLAGHADVVGAPKARLRVVSPDAERSQGRPADGDVTGNLVLFAKVYDVAPDGSRTLVNRLTAPARVPDARKPFTVTLPAVAHRYRAGHRLEFTIAAGDSAYYGNRGVKHVAVTSAPDDTGTLDLPVVAGSLRTAAR